MSQTTTESPSQKKTARRTRSRATAPPTRATGTSAVQVESASTEQPVPSAGPSVPVPVPEVHMRHVHLPRVEVVSVPMPSVHVPDQIRRMVPNPVNNRLLWYGGLAGLAAFGVIGWPVAGVVAAGTYVAEHRAKAAVHHDGDRGLTGSDEAS